MKFVKEYWVPTTLMAVLLGFSAYLQLEMFWSPMVIDAEFWQKKLEFHMSCGPFAIRYFQNYTTLAVSHLFGICTRDAFYGVQFFLALLLGPVFYKYLRKIDFNRVWSNIGVILLATAYPILGAHFAPTHTWDDFWSYHFLLFALLAAVDRRILFVGVFFTLGLLAREQIILFYPILLMLLWWSRHKIGSLKLFSTLILPIVVFVAFRIVVFEDIDPRRWELYAFNFGNVCRTTDTLVSTIIAFGFMWMASVIGLVELRKESMQDYGRLLFWGGITATALTTAVTLLFSMARETRIFFPPFVFVIPLSLVALRSIFVDIDWRWSLLKWILSIVALCLMLWLGINMAGLWFPEFDYKANSDLRRFLAGIHLGISMFVLGLYIMKSMFSSGKRISVH